MKDFKEEHLKEVIDKQFEIAWHTDMTYEKAVEMSAEAERLTDMLISVTDEDAKEWIRDEIELNTFYRVYKTTEEKEAEFRTRLDKYLIKFMWNSNAAKKQAWMLMLNWGLTIAV